MTAAMRTPRNGGLCRTCFHMARVNGCGVVRAMRLARRCARTGRQWWL